LKKERQFHIEDRTAFKRNKKHVITVEKLRGREKVKQIGGGKIQPESDRIRGRERGQRSELLTGKRKKCMGGEQSTCRSAAKEKKRTVSGENMGKRKQEDEDDRNISLLIQLQEKMRSGENQRDPNGGKAMYHQKDKTIRVPRFSRGGTYKTPKKNNN